jgi:hypothetical protein
MVRFLCVIALGSRRTLGWQRSGFSLVCQGKSDVRSIFQTGRLSQGAKPPYQVVLPDVSELDELEALCDSPTKLRFFAIHFALLARRV